MPVKQIGTLHGQRIRVTMRKGQEVSFRHFAVEAGNSIDKYVEAKKKKGWKLNW